MKIVGTWNGEPASVELTEGKIRTHPQSLFDILLVKSDSLSWEGISLGPGQKGAYADPILSPIGLSYIAAQEFDTIKSGTLVYADNVADSSPSENAQKLNLIAEILAKAFDTREDLHRYFDGLHAPEQKSFRTRPRFSGRKSLAHSHLHLGKSFRKSLTKDADTTAEEEDPLERAEAIADLLLAIYGDEALELLDDVDGEKYLQKAMWEPDKHPRGKNGRFIKKNSAEAVEATKDKIKESLKQNRNPESVGTLMNYLNILTTKQIRDLQKDYGVSASGANKAELVDKIARRLDIARRGEDGVPPEGEYPSYSEWAEGERERNRGKKEDKKPNNKPKPKDTAKAASLFSVIKKRGGIDPKQIIEYGGLEELRQSGLLGVTVKGGMGLDEMADVLEREGQIQVPEDMEAGEYLVEALKGKAITLHDAGEHYAREAEREFDEYLKRVQGEFDQPEIDETVRTGEEEGTNEADSREVEEVLGELAGEELGGDTSFDFGANESSSSGGLYSLSPDDFLKELGDRLGDDLSNIDHEQIPWDLNSYRVGKNGKLQRYIGTKKGKQQWMTFDITDSTGELDRFLRAVGMPSTNDYFANNDYFTNHESEEESEESEIVPWSQFISDFQAENPDLDYSDTFLEMLKRNHRENIEDAIQYQPDLITPEVLADYPDLAEKYNSPNSDLSTVATESTIDSGGGQEPESSGEDMSNLTVDDLKVKRTGKGTYEVHTPDGTFLGNITKGSKEKIGGQSFTAWRASGIGRFATSMASAIAKLLERFQKQQEESNVH